MSSQPVSKRLIERNGIVVCVADEPLPALTNQQVRDLLESGRRRNGWFTVARLVPIEEVQPTLGSVTLAADDDDFFSTGEHWNDGE
jgi:hypothetical protein